jgi:hypothetical protein
MCEPRRLTIPSVSTACYRDRFAFLYVDYVRTSQEARTTTVRYGYSFALLYGDGVRTSQEAWNTMVRYGDSFAFLYVDDVRTSQEAWATTVRYMDSFTSSLYSVVGLEVLASVVTKSNAFCGIT